MDPSKVLPVPRFLTSCVFFMDPLANSKAFSWVEGSAVAQWDDQNIEELWSKDRLKNMPPMIMARKDSRGIFLECNVFLFFPCV